VAAPTFGFDLDMTLVDSASSIVDALLHVAERLGGPGDPVPDPAALAATVGLPLADVFPGLVPGVPYDQALALYRARYLSHGVAMSRALPGAQASLELLRAHGQRIVVISAKHAGHVDAVLTAVGLRELVDAVEGESFGRAKGHVLATYRAWAYAGDHPGDIVGARVAGATAIGVATGPTPAAALADADVVLADLTELPGWLMAGDKGPGGFRAVPAAGSG
jgi:phosphoglycolate phosphatase